MNNSGNKPVWHWYLIGFVFFYGVLTLGAALVIAIAAGSTVEPLHRLAAVLVHLPGLGLWSGMDWNTTIATFPVPMAVLIVMASLMGGAIARAKAISKQNAKINDTREDERQRELVRRQMRK